MGEEITLPPIAHEAVAYAAKAHKGQSRKYTGEPYIVHPIEVMMITATAMSLDNNMLVAAALHDVVEDTHLSIDHIDFTFGLDVAGLVAELTEPKTEGNREARKAVECQRLATISPRAQTIKLADLISNSRSIIDRAPGFAKVYLAEKAAILRVMKQGDSDLWQQAWDMIPAEYRGEAA